MFLRTLTLKGFKSFADPTTLQMEPGVTVVVGPNGSGKSNVVDAIAWVLGAQGPRVVRSAKMDDVIFAGTSSRPALGRAEVSLTIDNSARRLPIEFNEVTVTRTLFRTGESEYAINGVPCRLLDVQELLSDTGVGRQQHVIIGQGQLDTMLTARPEDRRAVIEEAAGVLKYRRRRERAERRLESSEASLARLEDLLREVRRQIRPLERQAASARRHAELSEESRAVRLHLLGREIAALEARLGSAGEAAQAATARRAELVVEGERIDGAIAAELQALGAVDVTELDAELARAGELRERARGLLTRCEERRRAQAELAEALGATSALERLEAEQRRIDAELAATESAATALGPEWAALEAAEAQHAADEARQLARIEALEAPLRRPGTLFAAAAAAAAEAEVAGGSPLPGGADEAPGIGDASWAGSTPEPGEPDVAEAPSAFRGGPGAPRRGARRRGPPRRASRFAAQPARRAALLPRPGARGAPRRPAGRGVGACRARRGLTARGGARRRSVAVRGGGADCRYGTPGGGSPRRGARARPRRGPRHGPGSSGWPRPRACSARCPT